MIFALFYSNNLFLAGNNYGGDYHPRCLITILVGASVKGGISFGANDNLNYKITWNSVHVRDHNATV